MVLALGVVLVVVVVWVLTVVKNHFKSVVVPTDIGYIDNTRLLPQLLQDLGCRLLQLNKDETLKLQNCIDAKHNERDTTWERTACVPYRFTFSASAAALHSCSYGLWELFCWLIWWCVTWTLGILGSAATPIYEEWVLLHRYTCMCILLCLFFFHCCFLLPLYLTTDFLSWHTCTCRGRCVGWLCRKSVVLSSYTSSNSETCHRTLFHF